jgi:hypothetical protein
MSLIALFYLNFSGGATSFRIQDAEEREERRWEDEKDFGLDFS